VIDWRFASRLATVAATLALLASCGGEVPGTPTTVDPTGSTGSTGSPSRTSTRPAPPTTTAAGPDLTAIDPCELLTPSERAQLDLPAGEADTTAGNRECVWNQSGDRAVASVTLRARQGVDDIGPGQATKIEDVTVGGHTGRRLEDPDGYCSYDLAITDKSSVTVATLIDGKIAEACAFAQRVVTVVEPKLPKG
jgi:hypothetical protein